VKPDWFTNTKPNQTLLETNTKFPNTHKPKKKKRHSNILFCYLNSLTPTPATNKHIALSFVKYQLAPAASPVVPSTSFETISFLATDDVGYVIGSETICSNSHRHSLINIITSKSADSLIVIAIFHGC
jgi:hypothetical protein